MSLRLPLHGRDNDELKRLLHGGLKPLYLPAVGRRGDLYLPGVNHNHHHHHHDLPIRPVLERYGLRDEHYVGMQYAEQLL